MVFQSKASEGSVLRFRLKWDLFSSREREHILRRQHQRSESATTCADVSMCSVGLPTVVPMLRHHAKRCMFAQPWHAFGCLGSKFGKLRDEWFRDTPSPTIGLGLVLRQDALQARLGQRSRLQSVTSLFHFPQPILSTCQLHDKIPCGMEAKIEYVSQRRGLFESHHRDHHQDVLLPVLYPFLMTRMGKIIRARLFASF